MKYKIILSLAFAALLGISAGTQPVAATDNEPTYNEPTFVVTEPSADAAEIKLGSNLLVAGNGVISEKATSGLLFSAGNQLDLKTKSEYGFVAGNVVNFSAQTEKDLFLAGNIINIGSDARIGRDTFIAGNTVTVNANLGGGALSVTASKVVLNGVNINGDLNLDVAMVVFDGEVKVNGKIVINSDAEIIGLGSATYTEVEKYEVIDDTTTATSIWFAKLFSIVALFIAFAIIMAMFPGIKPRVEKELSATEFGKDVLIGMCVLLFVPIIAIFLLMSFVGAPAALILIAAYVVMLYLSQAFSGLWLGKLIVEKLTHSSLNAFLEMLIGITLLGLLTMIPWLGSYIGLLSMLLGLGLFMQTIKPNRKQKQIVISRTEEIIEDGENVKEDHKSEETSKSKSTSKAASKKSTKHTTDDPEEVDITEEE